MPGQVTGRGAPMGAGAAVGYRGAVTPYNVPQRQMPSVYPTGAGNSLGVYRGTNIPTRQMKIQSPRGSGIYTRGTGGLTASQPSVLLPSGTSTATGGPTSPTISGPRPTPSIARPTGPSPIAGPVRPVGAGGSIFPQSPTTRPSATQWGQLPQRGTPQQYPQYPSRATTGTTTTTNCTTSGNGIFGMFESTIGAMVRSLFGMSNASGCGVGTTGSLATTSTLSTTTLGTNGLGTMNAPRVYNPYGVR